MKQKKSYVIIIGGGLAGLVSAIHLLKLGISVILFEKDRFPKHKVCGEYISNEVLPYLKQLDLDIASLIPASLNNLEISTVQGNNIKHKLPLGGFGLSRYTLDDYLFKEAMNLGLEYINDQVIDIKFDDSIFKVKTLQQGEFTTSYVLGAYGKRSTLDQSLKRNGGKGKNYPWLAVKAHYLADIDSNTVALHTFEGGYCGLSKVENNLVNLCYLVNYDSFKQCKGIEDFQRTIMTKNPYLDSFF